MTSPHARKHYGNKVRTRADRVAAAINLIAFCAPERLAVLTAEDVAAHSGLALAECAEMLKRRRDG
jgi:hypothetical protein